MKIRAVLAGTALAVATLAFAHSLPVSTKTAALPVPLCPPDTPTCGLNK